MPSHRTAVKDTSLLRAIDQGTPLSGIEEEEHQRDAPADSQSSEDIDISQMIESMMKSTKRRREARRSAMHLEHSRRVDKARADVSRLIETHKDKRSRLHKVLLDRISRMITKRALIETRIIAHARALEAAYIAASNEMIVIIQGRDKDLDVPVSGAALSA